jgi:hypothetical protein
MRPQFSRSESEAPPRHLRAEGATARFLSMSFAEQIKPAGPKSHDDIIE